MRRYCDAFGKRRSCDTFVRRRNCDSLETSEEQQYKNVRRATFKTSDHISSELRQFTKVGRATLKMSNQISSKLRHFTNVRRATFKTLDHISLELQQFTNVRSTRVWETSEEQLLFASDGKSVGSATLCKCIGIATAWQTTLCLSSNCRSCDDYVSE